MRLALKPTTLVLAALMGTLTGLAVAATRTHADCAGNVWVVRLEEVTSTDPTSTQRRLWPEDALLNSDERSARLDLRATAGLPEWSLDARP